MQNQNKYSLFIYPKAEHMDMIFGYISQELSTPDVAINLIEKFYSALEYVRFFPLSCPLTSNIALKDNALRKLCVELYYFL